MYYKFIAITLVYVLAIITGFWPLYILEVTILVFIFIDLLALFSAPFVPTTNKNLEVALSFADIKPGMRVYDLGAGNGETVDKFAGEGANAVGYELSLSLVIMAWMKKIFFDKKGKVVWGNLWQQDLSDADVVFCYLMPHAMGIFERKKFNTLKKGTRLIANNFPLPTIKPDKVKSKVYLYIKK